MNLAKRIRDLRYSKGWGPDELANRAKISRTALYQIERGNTSKPQAGTLRRISRALGRPPGDPPRFDARVWERPAASTEGMSESKLVFSSGDQSECGPAHFPRIAERS